MNLPIFGKISEMKPVLLFPLMFCVWSCSKSTDKESTFYVRGNCEMCEERIEKATKEVKGVCSADWNVASSQLKVVYDSTQVSELDLHKAVAATGHGTKLIKMDDHAYLELPECCRINSGQ
jgi:Cu(I)/Ag(I) efflux system membrane fusion protein